MSDPFRPNSRSQLVREAQIGLSVVAVVLALFLYVAFYKIMGRGQEFPDHVLRAPVAETVSPGASPREQALERVFADYLAQPGFKDRSGVMVDPFRPSFDSTKSRTDNSLVSSNPGTANSRTVHSETAPTANSPATKLKNKFAHAATPKNAIASKVPPTRFANRDFNGGAKPIANSTPDLKPGIKLASGESDTDKAKKFAESLESIKPVQPTKPPARLTEKVTGFPAPKPPGNASSNENSFAPNSFAPNSFAPQPSLSNSFVPIPDSESKPAQNDGSTKVVSRLDLPESFGKSDFEKPKVEKAKYEIAQNPIELDQQPKPAIPKLSQPETLRPKATRQVTTPKASALDLVGFNSDSEVKMSSKPNGFASPPPQVERAFLPAIERPAVTRPPAEAPEVNHSFSNPNPTGQFDHAREPGASKSLRRNDAADSFSGFSNNQTENQTPGRLDASTQPTDLRSGAIREPSGPPTLVSPHPENGFENTDQDSVKPVKFSKPNVGRVGFNQSVRSESKSQPEFKPAARAEFVSEVANEEANGFGRTNSTAVMNSQTEKFSRTYVVGSGESFWSISEKLYQDGRYFHALYQYNKPTVPDFDNLPAGVTIGTPTKADLVSLWPDLCPKPDSQRVTEGPRQVYLTNAGDTLFDIARKNLGQASRFAEILKLNEKQFGRRITALSELPAGIRLVMPVE